MITQAASSKILKIRRSQIIVVSETEKVHDASYRPKNHRDGIIQ